MGNPRICKLNVITIHKYHWERDQGLNWKAADLWIIWSGYRFTKKINKNLINSKSQPALAYWVHACTVQKEIATLLTTVNLHLSTLNACLHDHVKSFQNTKLQITQEISKREGLFKLTGILTMNICKKDYKKNKVNNQ